MALLIRQYIRKDIEELLDEVGAYVKDETYNQETQDYFKGLDFSREKLYNFFIQHLHDKDVFVNLIFEDEKIVGGLCAYIASPIFSTTTYAYDQLLYVKPGFSHPTAIITVIKRYEKWAKARGASVCYLRTSTLYRLEEFTKLCNKLGYKHFETGFAKET